MVTSTQNMSTKLIELTHIMSTQMSLSLDCLGIDQLFRTKSLLYTYRNGWKNRLPVNRTTVKNEPVHTISYELHQYMPCSIIVLLIQFLLLLLFQMLSQPVSTFPTCHCQILFFLTTFIFLIHSQFSVSAHSSCAW